MPTPLTIDPINAATVSPNRHEVVISQVIFRIVSFRCRP